MVIANKQLILLGVPGGIRTHGPRIRNSLVTFGVSVSIERIGVLFNEYCRNLSQDPLADIPP
jgi:hypothetical protein